MLFRDYFRKITILKGYNDIKRFYFKNLQVTMCRDFYNLKTQFSSME
jgi:hypothetical protein